MKTIAIVSLSAGTIGEDFVRHETDLGKARLAAFGVKVKMMPHAEDGIAALKAHPEHRAADLLAAFADDEVDGILCAIGGDDTYRLAPYLFEGDALKKVIRYKPFLGFSDSTFNHLMLHKLGVPTFYGQSFLADVCDMAPAMLPYSEKYFLEWLRTGKIREVTPSPVWYDGRTDWSPAALGTTPPAHENGGFSLLQGAPRFSGKILGGCIDSLFDVFDNTRYADSVAVVKKYALFPEKEAWRGKILLLETSEEKPTPEKYRQMLRHLKTAGVFDAVSGILLGKPMDETYRADYEKIIIEEVGNPALPIVANVNIGHATPRCILPFGVPATVDIPAQKITFSDENDGIV